MAVYSVPPSDIPHVLGWNPEQVQSALAFPYPGTGGFVRLKVFPPYQDKRGHAVKYLQPKKTPPHLYVLPSVETILTNPATPLAVVEGEKKTAAMVQAGVMAVGVGGIWAWVESKTNSAIVALDRITWVEREVALYFDSDIWHRPELLNAVYALGKELEERGARVAVAIIEQQDVTGKAGIDDLLVAKGCEALNDLKRIPLTHAAFTRSKAWWKKWRARRDRAASSSSSSLQVTADLKGFIHQTRKWPEYVMKNFEKKQVIAANVTDRLRHTGTFYLTPERQSYFFDMASRTLHALAEEGFTRFLADVTGLNPTESEFRYLLEHLLTEVHQRGQPTQVYRLAHYDEASHRLFVTDFGSGLWLLDGKTVTPAPNGEAGVLFASTPQATPYTYLPAGQRPADATLAAFLEPIRFDPAARLSGEEWRDLLFVWLLSLFFPELHPTKIIPAFIGPHGSTKTTTARRFGTQLLGERFNVGHLESSERGEQAFIATLCGKPFAAFDNADAPIRWLPDRLATYATGQEFELRELYTTNTLAIHRPVANLMITSRDPHFRRPDVAERLLICRMARPERAFVPEAEWIRRTLAGRDGVWSDLLDVLNHALAALRQVPEAAPSKCRMADFAAFGWRLSHARGGAEAAARFYSALARIEEEQAQYATEEDQVAACLSLWTTTGGNLGREVDTATLYRELMELAETEGLLLPKTSAALGKHLHLSRRPLETALNLKISVGRTSHTSRWMFSRAKDTEEVADSALPAPPALRAGTAPTQPNGVEGGQEGQIQETC
ncbi:MAG: hypothetical protein A3D28_05135 [Omnitrophica bacterium RIFCSPHIGHO2_02_FULL_63_14]|nr:MAG: hypothetical protein A3D28_05135 [Omnitrophica bacterium RIFCSPHIGHO2_02_FULL_63_14]